MPQCFIIMPITTPQSVLSRYAGDQDHFRHVLDHLHVPAVERAGYDPILPAVKGSDLIQAEIIERLETADLVLCDMSALNPNVFFELGIRTALDKPVSLVTDSVTQPLPFDTSIINHHVYDPSLSAWTLESELESLTNHVISSGESDPEHNALWRYFGLTSRGTAPDLGGSPLEAKLDLVLDQIAQRRSNAPGTPRFTSPSGSDSRADKVRWLLSVVNEVAGMVNARILVKSQDEDSLILDLGYYELPDGWAEVIESLGTLVFESVRLEGDHRDQGGR